MMTNMYYRYVYHVSDIHIRINHRHEEYEQVFENLYDYLVKADSGLIVITGDVLHSKLELSPECLSITRQFLRRLSSIMPVIVIPGNHDCNLQNTDRLDALTPVTENIHSALHYIRDSGAYIFGNIIFGITSIYDDVMFSKELLEESPLYNKKYISIALYHGAVHKDKEAVGSRMNKNELVASDFDGYDYVMLGDIHRHHYLTTCMAYAGSLIQQSHGESLDNHGLIAWDILDGTSEHISIHNDYGFVTVKSSEYGILPKYPRIRFISEGNNNYEEIIRDIGSQYEIQEITNKTIVAPSNSDQFKDMENKDIFRDHLLQYLDNVGAANVDLIMKIHDKITSQLSDKVTNNQKIFILKLKFSDMFSYGSDNKISINNIPSGIIGIVAPNRYGKSSVVDIILFALFGKYSRGDTKDIINNKQSSCSCMITFMMGACKYKISRSCKRTGRSVKSGVEFCVKRDGIYSSLCGTDSKETTKIIPEYVGSYDDYINTYFMTQNDDSDFIKMKQMERKKYMYSLLKINQFDHIIKAAKDKHKIISKKINIMSGKLSNYNKDTYENKLQNVITTMHNMHMELDTLHDTLYDLYGRWAHVTYDENIPTVTHTTNEIKKLKGHISTIHDNYGDIISIPEDVMDLICDYDEFKMIDKKLHNCATYDMALLDNKLEKYNNETISHKYRWGIICKELLVLHGKYILAKQYISENVLCRASKFLYNDDCESCSHNKYILGSKDNEKEYAKCMKKIGKYDLLVDELVNICKQEGIHIKISLCDDIHKAYALIMTGRRNTYETMKQDLMTYTKNKQKLLLCEPHIASMSHNEKYKRTQDVIIKNTLYKERVDECEKMIDICKINDERRHIYNTIKKDIATTETTIAITTNKLLTLVESSVMLVKQTQELNKLNTTYEKYMTYDEAYKTYMKVINYNGLPYYILRDHIPKIQANINNILADISSFKINLVLNDPDSEKTANISINIDDGEIYNASMACGFERFVINMAVRMSMISISMAAKPNIMLIDEGWGCFDTSNIDKVDVIVNYLRANCDKVFIITHEQLLRGKVDTIINIDKKNKISKIFFL